LFSKNFSAIIVQQRFASIRSDSAGRFDENGKFQNISFLKNKNTIFGNISEFRFILKKEEKYKETISFETFERKKNISTFNNQKTL